MTFKEAFPDAKDGEEPIPGRLLKTTRHYGCGICGRITTWRFIANGLHETACCSDDCFVEMEDNQLMDSVN